MTSENATQHALKGLLFLIDGRISQLPSAGIVISAANRGFTQAQYQANHESWSLLRAGIAHLHAGAPDGTTGSLTQALTKASLRSSALAAGLGLQPPQFKQVKHLQPEHQGHAQAVFFARRLTEALAVDTPKSHNLIIRALHAKPIHDISADAAIEKLIRSENIRFFNKLAECHRANTETLREMVDTLPPPKTSTKPSSGNFDL